MLLTITTTQFLATDLGYLLHKNPARIKSEELSFGRAHVFYPEADVSCCTAAVLLEVDPVALVRGRRGPAGEGGQRWSGWQRMRRPKMKQPQPAAIRGSDQGTIRLVRKKCSPHNSA